MNKIKLLIANEVVEMSLEEIISKYKKSNYNYDDRINDEKVELFIKSTDGLNATIDNKDLTELLEYSKNILDNTFTYLWKKGLPLN